MRTAIFLILPITTLIFSPSLTQAQQVESSIDRPHLVLVTGDTPNSCSFIRADVLERGATIVGDLLFINSDDSPDRVRSKVRFAPDSVTGNTLQWTATAGGNYTRAVVNFSDNRVQQRTFTMVTNYNQPDEKRCEWRVEDPQQRNQTNSSTSPLGQ